MRAALISEYTKHATRLRELRGAGAEIDATLDHMEHLWEKMSQAERDYVERHAPSTWPDEAG